MPRKDAVWATTDPQGKRIKLLKTTLQSHIKIGKHLGPDAMTVEEARHVVEEPDFITQSVSCDTRKTFYIYKQAYGCPPYLRTTVDYKPHGTSDCDGVAISWSRYRKPDSGTVIYTTSGKESPK
jgi:hypothetical protein